MVEPGNQLSRNLKYWSLVSVSDKKLVVQLHFDKPLTVSQKDDSDQLLLNIRMSEWKTKDSKSVPE